MQLDPAYEKKREAWKDALADLKTARDKVRFSVSPEETAAQAPQQALVRADIEKAKERVAETRAALDFPWDRR